MGVTEGRKTRSRSPESVAISVPMCTGGLPGWDQAVPKSEAPARRGYAPRPDWPPLGRTGSARLGGWFAVGALWRLTALRTRR